jgi:hypothetical protein
MTQTKPPTGIGTPPNHPAGILMNLIAALLAPMFLCVTAGDINLARLAAIETIHTYQARNHADLIAVAQIIACGLAVLASLSQSMEDEISLSMTLRLRGNAVALNRSAEQNRRSLKQPLRDDPTPYHPELPPEPEPEFAADPTSAESLLSAAAAQQLAAEADARLTGPVQTARTPVPAPAQIATQATDHQATEKRHQQMWAIALVNEASEITASIPSLPPAERSTASLRAGLLSSTANELLTGMRPPPPIPPRPNSA